MRQPRFVYVCIKPRQSAPLSPLLSPPSSLLLFNPRQPPPVNRMNIFLHLDGFPRHVHDELYSTSSLTWGSLPPILSTVRETSALSRGLAVELAFLPCNELHASRPQQHVRTTSLLLCYSLHLSARSSCKRIPSLGPSRGRLIPRGPSMEQQQGTRSSTMVITSFPQREPHTRTLRRACGRS
ncbi:hypothetical protein IE53DRAFT_19961 [Violaceomyces palustris]|uniref:Uncharacterized protein n=1 Tax=Violaceomyces palustris TaxID=1673888 RepID=A0ACD0P1Y8_9BASI|nr:hypothetical protein IE53DRAFT_19961 [Violaceomyces palustris]